MCVTLKKSHTPQFLFFSRLVGIRAVARRRWAPSRHRGAPPVPPHALELTLGGPRRKGDKNERAQFFENILKISESVPQLKVDATQQRRWVYRRDWYHFEAESSASIWQKPEIRGAAAEGPRAPQFASGKVYGRPSSARGAFRAPLRASSRAGLQLFPSAN